MTILVVNRDLLSIVISHDNISSEQGPTLNSSHLTIILMNRDLLSTVSVYCLSILAESLRVSLIIVQHVYAPTLETCTSLSVRSNDTIEPVNIPSVVLRGLNSGSTHTICAPMTSIVIFTIHETVISEPIRNVLEGVTSIETAVENLEF